MSTHVTCLPSAGASPASLPSHWDSRYLDVGSANVSWSQTEPQPSLSLLTEFCIDRHVAIVDVGGGTSALVERLLDAKYTDLTVVDISQVALDELGARLSARPSAASDSAVARVCADVRVWRPTRAYQAWHDRATYHFLVDPAEQQAYWDLVRSHLPEGGVLVIGVFSESGPAECSSLPVRRYSVGELVSTMGAGFHVVRTMTHVHVTPSGSTQPFTWVVAKRHGAAGDL